MIITDLNEVPEAIASGKITEKEAVNEIAVFLIKNYPVFGLHKYDEDFRSEVLTRFLENGQSIFKIYNPELGDFFTYFYSYIKNIIRTKLKKYSRTSIQEAVAIQESILNYDEKLENYSDSEDFSYNDKSKKENINFNINNYFKDSEKDEKTLLILALKSSYYLTDEQIDKICKKYSLDKNNFYNLIQHCKEQMNRKIERRQNVEERRNSAYFRHKRYVLEKIKNENEDNNISVRNLILEKDYKQKTNWININERLEKGYLYLRPTNKVIANVLGICERQVSYYINYAKKLEEKNK